MDPPGRIFSYTILFRLLILIFKYNLLIVLYNLLIYPRKIKHLKYPPFYYGIHLTRGTRWNRNKKKIRIFIPQQENHTESL